MNIPLGSIISFTRTSPYDGTKTQYIGEYLAESASNLSLVVIKILNKPEIKPNGQYFPIDVLDTAIILYPNIESFYNENPEYLL